MRVKRGVRESLRALRCEALEARHLLAAVADPTWAISSADQLIDFALLSPTAPLDAAPSSTQVPTFDAQTVLAAALPDPGSASVFDVRDYGAVGDGVTDDSAAITAALNAANAAGGGAVYFSAGTYLVNQTLPLYPNVYHHGDGIGDSIIQQGEAATGSLFRSAAISIFNFGGFSDLTLRGESNHEFIGIDMSLITSYLGVYHIDSIEVDGFDVGYYGAPFEYQNMTTRSTFKNNTHAGAVVFENPYIYDCSFINNEVGLTGRLIDAFLMNNVFMGNDIGLAASSGQKIAQSTISSNIFSGNLAIGMVIDDQNTVNNNWIDSGSLTTPAQIGILVRDDLNSFANNRFGRLGPSPHQDFSTAAIYFSELDRFGNPHSLGVFGYNTIITQNTFIAEAGPAVVAAPAMSLTGVSVLDNSFELHGQAAIVFNADESSWVRGNLISNNSIVLAANMTAPAIQIARSFYGNSLEHNAFTVNTGVVSNGLISLDGRGTIFLGNTAAGVTVGDQPWRFNAVDSKTTLRDNQAFDANGHAVGLFSDSGTVTVSAAASAVYVPFSSQFALVPSVSSFRVSIVGDPGNTNALWVSSISASGFVLDLNHAPGTGSIQVSWSVVEQTYTNVAPQSAALPPVDVPAAALLPPLPIPDLSTLSVFNVKDFGAWGTGNRDDSAEIIAAINAAQAAGGGIVYFPAGKYLVNSTLPLLAGVYFQGDGANVSSISQGAAAAATMFQAPASATFDRGGFLDLSITGQASRTTDGIDFSLITGPVTNIFFNHVAIVSFQVAYRGAANEQQTLMINSLFGGTTNAAVIANGDPLIFNCRFNGATIGLSGDMHGATIISNYFSSDGIAIAPLEGQRIRQSSIVGNVFTGNSLVGLIVDDANAVFGNIINGSTAAVPALAGLVIRGNNNWVSSNNFGLESGSPGVITFDFSIGNIAFSDTDWTGNPHAGGVVGTGTVIQHNNFTAQSGPAIVGPAQSTLSGVSVLGNSFGLIGHAGIVLNADPGYSVDGNTIADNSFVLKDHLTEPVLQIANTQFGNQITGNLFRAGGGVNSTQMVSIDAVGTTFVGNRATNTTVGQQPWMFTAIDSGTTIAANLAVDTAGNEVGLTESSGLKTVTAGQTSVAVAFAKPFALAPTAADLHFTFAASPGNATTAWATDVTAAGFTLHLDQAPGITTVVAWSAFGTEFVIANPVTAEVQGPVSALRDALQTFTLLASDGASASFTFTIDWGDGSAAQVVTGPSGTQVTHTFTTVGPRTVSVVAASSSGAVSPPATLNLNVTAVRLVPNVQNSALRDLVWDGTAGGDQVAFEQVSATTIRVVTSQENGLATNVSETINGVTGRVIASGVGGNDNLSAAALTTTQATLDGGAGNNTLYGGAAGDILIGGFNGAEGQQGNNVIIAGNGSNTIYGNGVVGIKGATGGNNLIVGGSGADTIYGAFGSVSPSDGGEGGRNLIVSGAGADVIYASQQADGAEGGHGSILVSGTTSLSQSALLAVLSEWTSERDYMTRVANILGIGTGPRNNGNYFLLPGSTVFNDAAVDQVFGDSQGQSNWFMMSVLVDQLERYKSGEVIIGLP